MLWQVVAQEHVPWCRRYGNGYDTSWNAGMTWSAARGTPDIRTTNNRLEGCRVPSGRGFKPRTRLARRLKTEMETLHFVLLMARGMA